LTVSRLYDPPSDSGALPDKRELSQFETDNISRESTHSPHDVPSPSIIEYEQSSNHSLENGESRSLNCTPSKESSCRDDDDSLNELRGDRERARLDDTDLETIRDDENLSDEETDLLSNSEEEAHIEEVSDSEEGSTDDNEVRSSSCVEDTSLDSACSLLARYAG
jgi:hypothetical protein